METNEIIQPSIKDVRAKAIEYAKSEHNADSGIASIDYCKKDFIAGADWFRQQIILLNKESEGTK